MCPNISVTVRVRVRVSRLSIRASRICVSLKSKEMQIWWANHRMYRTSHPVHAGIRFSPPWQVKGVKKADDNMLHCPEGSFMLHMETCYCCVLFMFHSSAHWIEPQQKETSGLTSFVLFNIGLCVLGLFCPHKAFWLHWLLSGAKTTNKPTFQNVDTAAQSPTGTMDTFVVIY